MSHIWMRHVTHMNKSRHTYEWVTWHISASDICGMNYSYVWHMCDMYTYLAISLSPCLSLSPSPSHTHSLYVLSQILMTHWCVWHDSLKCVTWLIHMCDMTHSYVWHDSFICVTCLIDMCDMTHSYAWHDSLMCDMTHSYVWHDSLICVTWLIHMCDMSHSYVWYDSFTCVTYIPSSQAFPPKPRRSSFPFLTFSFIL